LTSVQQLANGVQVAGMDGRLDQDVHDDRAEVGKAEPGVIPPLLRLRRGVPEVTGGDDLVGMSDGGPVGAQYVGGGSSGSTCQSALSPSGQKLSGSPATTTSNQYRSSDRVR